MGGCAGCRHTGVRQALDYGRGAAPDVGPSRCTELHLRRVSGGADRCGAREAGVGSEVEMRRLAVCCRWQSLPQSLPLLK